MNTKSVFKFSNLYRGLLVLLAALSANVQSATTDLATIPLVTSSSTAVLPNVLFVLDDSGSMAWTHMPDEASDGGSSVAFVYGFYGLRSSQCNGVYYDPSFTYTLPVYANGTNYPNATFTSAWTDGFAGTGSVNLSSAFAAGDNSGSGDGSGSTAYYYRYSGTQTTEVLKKYHEPTSTFYKECNSASGAAPGNAVFTKVVVNGTTGPVGRVDERQNFANWYSYYRTRMLTMKTAAGLAFKPIDNRFRVGFLSMNNSTSGLVNLSAFDAVQKAAWYAKFYSSTPSGSTPLRDALADAGRLFAGKYTTLKGVSVVDPMQYSCQQNFAILSTDGYWNQTGTPKQIDGSTDIGNVDGTEPRPFNDGGSIIITTKTPTTRVVQTETTTARTTTIPWTRSITTLGGACGGSTAGGGCVTDGNSRLWCMYGNNSTGSTGSCFRPGNNNAYACRNFSGVSAATTGGVGCKVDSSGQNWCVFTSNSAAVGTSCTQLGTATGPRVYVCKPVSTAGTSVTVLPQTYTETISSSVVSVNNSTATTTVTVVTTNGTAAPSSTTTVGPATINVSNSATILSDTGAPSGTTSWTNGIATTTCRASPPAAGTSAAASGTPVVVNGAASTVTLSDTTTPGSVTSTTTTSGGTPNTLADVAEYYYLTDLRTTALTNTIGSLGSSVELNNVPTSGADSASWQHMTTFTLGLGARGRMVYSPNYLTATSAVYSVNSAGTPTTGDYFAILNAVTANPAAGICSWQTAGTTCNWPVPGLNGSDGKIENVDDLWHAAINGRGNFYSASNPNELATGISSALAGVSARDGTSAAANTSNPNVTSGDNFDFNSTFTTNEWAGQLQRFQIDLTTGVESSTADWETQDQLDANTARVAAATTTVYTRDTSGTNNLVKFTYANLSAANKAYFNLANITSLSQFCAVGANCLSAPAKVLAAGANLVDFLRGDRTYEGLSSDPTTYYRKRDHVLGDIVNAEAVYVRNSTRTYVDTGYSAFAASTASRPGRVYVAANDGMVHAFNSDTGAETFAYIPEFVLPELYKLADKNYKSLHKYFVDGTPVTADVYFGGAWHTILVGGQNGGGKGYYALDITDAAAPKSLWEFSDANLGFTYGNPIVNKLKDGTWVVMFASGYNNIGDGVGRLYVVDAGTGTLIRTISTGVGSVATPSGLSKITGWVDNARTDNTALRVYGGDLLGNLWRFDVNGDIGAAGYDAQLLVTLVDAGGNRQPITSKPALGEISQTYPVVMVGTGRYLGTTDLADTSQQTMYAIKDTLGTTTFGNPRLAANKFVQQTQTTTTCPAGSPANVCTAGQVARTTSNNAVDFASNDNGWYVDLPDTGERINTDPVLVKGTLRFNANVPNVSACNVGGYSYAYFLNFRTGSAVSTAGTVSSVKLANALATRPVVVGLPDGSIVDLNRISDGKTLTVKPPIDPGIGTTRRISWREIVTE